MPKTIPIFRKATNLPTLAQTLITQLPIRSGVPDLSPMLLVTRHHGWVRVVEPIQHPSTQGGIARPSCGEKSPVDEVFEP